MENYFRLLERNHIWAETVRQEDPEYFARREKVQAPHFLFIGCSDSRITADRLTGTEPGEMFVHRNIANQVFPNDLNVLSVLQYAVEVLDVKHVIVCGHYGCGGVKAAFADDVHYGLVDYWLADIRATRRRFRPQIDALPDEESRLKRLVELNVLRQVANLADTVVVRSAWERGRRPLLHGLVYSLHDGHLHELVRGVDCPESALAILRGAAGLDAHGNIPIEP